MLVPWEASCCSLKKWRRGNWVVVLLEKFSAGFSSVFNSLASQMLTLRSLSLAKRFISYWVTHLSNYLDMRRSPATVSWWILWVWPGNRRSGARDVSSHTFLKEKVFFNQKQKRSNKNLNRSPASAVVLKSKHKEIFLKKGCSCES